MNIYIPTLNRDTVVSLSQMTPELKERSWLVVDENDQHRLD